MGLDMYLRGRKQKYKPISAERRKEDGYDVVAEIVELDMGYWRKHPGLHGFIVQTFAGGNDDCRDIELGASDLGSIITAAHTGAYPKGVTGFFFGESENTAEERARDVQIFNRALLWLNAEGKDYYRSVVYRASW